MAEMPPMELIPKGKLEQAPYFLSFDTVCCLFKTFCSQLETVNYLKELLIKLNSYLELHQIFEAPLSN